MTGAPQPEPAPSGTLRPAAALSRAIARGEPAALAEFYEVRFDWMYDRARALTGRDESFCLDVVQETMLRVARGMRAVKDEDELDRWAARALRSAAIDLLRREARARRRALARGPAIVEARAAGPVMDSSLREGLAALADDDLLLLKLR